MTLIQHFELKNDLLEYHKLAILKIDLLYVKIFWVAPKLKGDKVMDFIRKNWSRLSLAFLFFLGGVIAVIAWINNSGRIANADWLNAFYNTVLLISTIVFFFGMVGIAIMKSMQNSKKIVSMLYMSIGGLITLMLLILIIVAGCNQSTLVLVFGNGAVTSFYQLWVPFFVFGMHPLIKGVTRFIEAETVPAKATVKPAAAPVTETVKAEKAAAPKAAAPKATAPAAKPAAKKAAPKKTPAAK